MSELKPCPLCKGEAGYYKEQAYRADGVMCTSCGLDLYLPGVLDARKEWNTRPIEDELRGLLEELVQQFDNGLVPPTREFIKRTREALGK